MVHDVGQISRVLVDAFDGICIVAILCSQRDLGIIWPGSRCPASIVTWSRYFHWSFSVGCLITGARHCDLQQHPSWGSTATLAALRPHTPLSIRICAWMRSQRRSYTRQRKKGSFSIFLFILFVYLPVFCSMSKGISRVLFKERFR